MTFARDLDLEGQLAVVRSMLADREVVLEQLREIERKDLARETGRLVLELGLSQHRHQVELLRELEARLAAEGMAA